MNVIFRRTLISLGVFSIFFCCGCSPQEEIDSYEVPKPDRMLAAIVPHGKAMWYFKVEGSRDTLAKVEPVFEDFIKSVRFSDGEAEKIQWDLPPGWQRRPGTRMRYATLVFGSEIRPFELTVFTFPRNEMDERQAILDNVNRWRDQMSLMKIEESQLEEHTRSVPLDGSGATLVNLLGTKTSGMAPPSRPPRIPTPPRRPPAELTFEVPEGWQAARGTGVSRYAFEVKEGEKRVDITISLLGGSLMDNLGRWYGQVQLGRISNEELQKKIKKIDVGGLEGSYVEFVGPITANPRKTILGVIAPSGTRSWFIKLSSDDPTLAQREKQRFEAFVKSIKFTPAAGADNGN